MFKTIAGSSVFLASLIVILFFTFGGSKEILINNENKTIEKEEFKEKESIVSIEKGTKIINKSNYSETLEILLKNIEELHIGILNLTVDSDLSSEYSALNKAISQLEEIGPKEGREKSYNMYVEIAREYYSTKDLVESFLLKESDSLRINLKSKVKELNSNIYSAKLQEDKEYYQENKK